jgi:hypothetical protein
MADSKNEVTNERLFTEINECTNVILKETNQIKLATLDLLEPIHINVRNIHQMVYDLAKEVKQLRTELATLQQDLHKQQ